MTNEQFQHWSALHEAAVVGDLITLRQLIDNPDVDQFAIDDDRLTALYCACQEGHDECVRMLLDAAKGDQLLIEILMKLSVDRATELANMQTDDGGSCVYVAAQDGYDRCLQLLIDVNANVNLTVQPVWAGPTDLSSGGGVHVAARVAQRNYYRCLRLLVPYIDRQILENSEVWLI